MTQAQTETQRTETHPLAKFWDRIAERYARKPVPNAEAYEAKLAMTRAVLRPEMEVLEFGCGTGSTALAHAPYVRRILATDIAPKMIEIARRKAAAAGVETVQFACTDLAGVEAVPEGLDAVLGLNILHLVPDLDDAVTQVFGLLKPGGVFVSSTACLADFLPVFKWIGPVGYALGLIPFVKVFSSGELEASLTRAGFIIERRWQTSKKNGVFLIVRKPGGD
ncbi:MAG: class I SAM-dependent methyltransferase [Rhodospirillaceae bacterium]